MLFSSDICEACRALSSPGGVWGWLQHPAMGTGRQLSAAAVISKDLRFHPDLRKLALTHCARSGAGGQLRGCFQHSADLITRGDFPCEMRVSRGVARTAVSCSQSACAQVSFGSQEHTCAGWDGAGGCFRPAPQVAAGRQHHAPPSCAGFCAWALSSLLLGHSNVL